ncbi:MAG: transcription elongation factor GreA [Planctomycetes bacterium]|nr:transcription elongation factor GreA [Planctomycetota bacterium]
MPDKLPMTADGLKKLQSKLEQLTNQARPAVEKRLGEARDLGDLSENAEFSSAREELWRVDRQIAELKDQLNRSEIITSKQIDKNIIAFGARVKVKDIDTAEEEIYLLVGEGESNLAENKIAVTTPIGQGLLGHKVGDKVKIPVPAGMLSYQIIEIRYDL